MNDALKELEIECQRAAEEFLSLNWGNSKPRVRAAVDEMLSGSKLFTSSMAWLLRESVKLPVQAEPARRLNDLVVAISALRARKSQLEYFPVPGRECGAA
ncbi:MAG TPA: hypothetical protein VHO24_05390 [Opitutaceae bacterium]|nr:hypothetical protein [Opitutaceae bacterium]